jgi:hypothetical protein
MAFQGRLRFKSGRRYHLIELNLNRMKTTVQKSLRSAEKFENRSIRGKV